MNKNLLAAILISTFAVPAIADKPEWAGKEKPTEEQKAVHETTSHETTVHQTTMEAKDDLENDRVKMKEDTANEVKGLEKQNSMKSEQVRKELDKGSDKGKAAREENSKKWWKFWGE